MISRISVWLLAAVSAEAFILRPSTLVSNPPAKSTALSMAEGEKKRVVVVGNGMVGQRFMENLLKLDEDKKCQISTFCEEPRAAYNRVKLTSFFETLDPSSLSMTEEYDGEGRTVWYDENGVELLLKDKAVKVDTKAKTVIGASGKSIPYDACIMATGSFPFVPPIPGNKRPGVFVYRTIEDLEAMLKYAKENNVKSAAVIGGGLLGLEAAKAAKDMGLTSHVIEFAPILMCRQIDQGGHNALVGKIEEMGLHVHCGARTEAFVGSDGSTDKDSTAPVKALRFSNEDWDDLPVEMVIISAGIKPRDELAREAGLAIGERGGIVVDDQLRASEDGVYAIGEIALHNNFIYGLIAPGKKTTDIDLSYHTCPSHSHISNANDFEYLSLFSLCNQDISTRMWPLSVWLLILESNPWRKETYPSSLEQI